MFPDIVDLESETYGRVAPNIEHQNIHIESGADNDVEILVSLIRDQVLKDLRVAADEPGRDPDLPLPSIIVFCENKTKLNKICEKLSEINVLNLPFHDNTKSISLKMRYRTLNLLNEGKVPVLVSDNLGNRGLDTMNVSHVIQFEYAKSAQEYL